MRRGEVVGLRWSRIDLDQRVIYVRRQLQRIDGELYEDSLKGRRGRPVPLPHICVVALRWQRLRQTQQRERAGEGWEDHGDFVFTTRTGRPIEARNLYRSFTRIAADGGLRVVRLHDTRHGCATLLTACGVAPRVVMAILGHSQIGVTMNVYTHVVEETQRDALTHMDRLLKRHKERPEP